MKYRSYILTSQSVFCHCIFSGHFSFLSLLKYFSRVFSLFHPPPFFFPCLLQFFFSVKGVFYTHNTSREYIFNLALLSHSFFFLLSLFLLLSSLSFFSFSLSLPCRFLVRRPPPCCTASDGLEAPLKGVCVRYLRVGRLYMALLLKHS